MNRKRKASQWISREEKRRERATASQGPPALRRGERASDGSNTPRMTSSSHTPGSTAITSTETRASSGPLGASARWSARKPSRYSGVGGTTSDCTSMRPALRHPQRRPEQQREDDRPTRDPRGAADRRPAAGRRPAPRRPAGRAPASRARSGRAARGPSAAREPCLRRPSRRCRPRSRRSRRAVEKGGRERTRSGSWLRHYVPSRVSSPRARRSGRGLDAADPGR